MLILSKSITNMINFDEIIWPEIYLIRNPAYLNLKSRLPLSGF
jgi:hypothetical protein